MPKLRVPHKDWLDRNGPGHMEYLFRCPGCKYDHRVIVKSGRGGPEWGFNHSMEYPTFSPSLLVREYDGDTVVRVCHSYITDGKIQFLGDCTHELKGKTVEMYELNDCTFCGGTGKLNCAVLLREEPCKHCQGPKT